MKDEDKCEEQAVVERFWPGEKPDLVCLDHAIDTKKVAEALSVHVEMRPLTIGRLQELLESPKCACSKGHPQEINVNANTQRD